MSAERRSSKLPPQLREFVETVESRAEASGHNPATAKVYGAWSACYVRFCTVNNRAWQEPDHVTAFARYLQRREDMDAGSRRRALQGLVFLFENLLNESVVGRDWYPEAAPEASTETATTAPAEKTSPSSETASPQGDGQAGPAPERASAAEEPEESAEKSSLLTRVLFHTSLPIHEALDLRAGDIDADAGVIYVSDALGTPKRIVELPDAVRDAMETHLRSLRQKHGPSFLDAPLFQANALSGRVQDEDESADGISDPAPEQASSESSKSLSQTSRPEDRRESLWNYTEDG